MKRFGIGSTALLFVLFGVTSCFAQDKPEQHEEKVPAQHEEKAPMAQHQEKAPAQHEQKAQPAQHQEKAQTAPREQKAQPTEHASKPQQAKPATQHSQPVRSAARTSPSTRTTASNRTQHTTTAGPSEQSHNFGGHGGGRIADVKFRASFGSSHHFRMNRPEIYQGYSRFSYGGYYFGFYDPWPSDWGYSDDVYVDFIDGQYYLIDPEHPGPRLMVSVVF